MDWVLYWFLNSVGVGVVNQKKWILIEGIYREDHEDILFIRLICISYVPNSGLYTMVVNILSFHWVLIIGMVIIKHFGVANPS